MMQELSDRHRDLLAMIGEYSVQSTMLDCEFYWETPKPLENDWTPFDLLFFVETGGEEIDLNAALTDVLNAWAGIGVYFGQVLPEFKPDLRRAFEETPNPDGEDFEEGLEGGCVEIHWSGGQVTAKLRFFVDWEPEHGVEFQLGPDE